MPRCSPVSRANPKGPAHPERAGGGPAGKGDAAESGMEAEAVARFRPSKGFLLETASPWRRGRGPRAPSRNKDAAGWARRVGAATTE